MTRSSRLALLFVAAPLALAACHKKKPVVEPPPPVTQEVQAPTPVPHSDPPPPPTVDPNIAINAAKVKFAEVIYFDYDAAELRSDAQALLTEKLPILTANPQIRIRINGHCDERGSDVYNIALGKRRAEMAKRFLTDRGVDASRIETFSFGRERPAQAGSTEEAWARNRRDEFEITAGEITKAP